MTREEATYTTLLDPVVHEGILSWIEANAYYFGLVGWTFNLHWEFITNDDEALAQVRPVDETPYCHVMISRDFVVQSAEVQREALVHEMLHPLLAHAFDLIRIDLRPLLVASTHDFVWAAFKRDIELRIDMIARGLAPLLPYIEWPGGPDADDESRTESAPGDGEALREKEGHVDLLRQGEQRRKVRPVDGQGSPQGST